MKNYLHRVLAGVLAALLCVGVIWVIGWYVQKNGGNGDGSSAVTQEAAVGAEESNGAEHGTDGAGDGAATDGTVTDGTVTDAAVTEGEASKSDDGLRPGDGTEGETSEDDSAQKNGKESSRRKKQWKKDRTADAGAEPVEVVKGPPKIMVASDTHLLAKELMDDGKAFMARMEANDGKTTAYSEEIVDVLVDEAMREKPDALVLSGDLTFEGERLSHEVLAGKLNTLQNAGVQVLVIPGNHDINNPRAASYLDEEDVSAEDAGGWKTDKTGGTDKMTGDDVDLEDPVAGESAVKNPDDPITAAEFAKIYHDFGYAQAISRDENSLSYIYPLRDNIWLMMLDTNQYDPVNLVDGEIRPETYQWMIKELDKADEAGVLVVPIGHHNLLSVSRIYTRECMILSRDSALWLFGEHQLPLYLSGHLHVQRMKKYKTEPGVPGEAYGIHEIVTSSLGMTPHQYGVLSWDENYQMEYIGRRLDVEAYARGIGSQDENLLNFNQYSKDWYYSIVEKQVYKKLHDFPEDTKQDMAHIYADVLYHYGAGETVNQKDVETSRGYRMWNRLLPDSKWMSDINMMLKDMKEIK